MTSRDEQEAILPDVVYECVRCGTRVNGRELAGLPEPTCVNCGYRVFRKAKGPRARQLKAE